MWEITFHATGEVMVLDSYQAENYFGSQWWPHFRDNESIEISVAPMEDTRPAFIVQWITEDATTLRGI
jgi:hypothetical protein